MYIHVPEVYREQNADRNVGLYWDRVLVVVLYRRSSSSSCDSLFSYLRNVTNVLGNMYIMLCLLI